MNRSYFIPIIAIISTLAGAIRGVLDAIVDVVSGACRAVVEFIAAVGTADRIANARQPLQLSARDSAATLRRRLEARRNHFASIDLNSRFFGSVRASPA